MERGTMVMSRLKPELSKSNKYYVEKHRYYELKHFCLQYEAWKEAYRNIDGLERTNEIINRSKYSKAAQNSTARCAALRMYLAEKIELVEDCCKKTDKSLYEYILKGVTTDMPYETLRLKYNIPCCRDTYYELYRRFFWILDNSRK